MRDRTRASRRRPRRIERSDACPPRTQASPRSAGTPGRRAFPAMRCPRLPRCPGTRGFAPVRGRTARARGVPPGRSWRGHRPAAAPPPRRTAGAPSAPRLSGREGAWRSRRRDDASVPGCAAQCGRTRPCPCAATGCRAWRGCWPSAGRRKAARSHRRSRPARPRRPAAVPCLRLPQLRSTPGAGRAPAGRARRPDRPDGTATRRRGR